MAYTPPPHRRRSETPKSSLKPSFAPKQRYLNQEYTFKKISQLLLGGDIVVTTKDNFKNWFIFCSQTDDHQLLSHPIRLDSVLPKSWVAWPDEKDLCEVYQVSAMGVYNYEDKIGYTVLSNALSKLKNLSLRYVPRGDSQYLTIMDLDECYVSYVKIAPWVYIADKIESYLVASIEHLRSKMGLGECEEVLKPVFLAHFDKVVFHGIPFSNFNTISKISGVEAALDQMEMNQVHYSVIDMSCLDKNLDLRLMLSSKRILTAQH
ncbi:hypothetical protein GIB67_018951, partial [Kingdonia uniflora]